jgi:hypothetical protein
VTSGPASSDLFLGVIAVVVAALVLGVVAARRHDRRRTAALQRAIDERLSSDPALAGLSIRARVRRGWLRGVEVELNGQVPSVWQRYASSRVVERELVQQGVRGMVVDRVMVVWRRRATGDRRSA